MENKKIVGFDDNTGFPIYDDKINVELKKTNNTKNKNRFNFNLILSIALLACSFFLKYISSLILNNIYLKKDSYASVEKDFFNASRNLRHSFTSLQVYYIILIIVEIIINSKYSNNGKFLKCMLFTLNILPIIIFLIIYLF